MPKSLPELNALGKLANHDKVAYQVVTGKADFAADRLPMNKWYGAVKGSTVMRGSIKSIDASAALAVPGVKAVVTYEDVPTWNQDIFQWGQEVAGVVADNWYTAYAATELIKVEYDVIPGIFDPDEAIKPGAVLSGIIPDTNVRLRTDIQRGEGGTAGLAKADVTIDATFPWSCTHTHNELEPHQSLAWWIGDEVYIWLPSQHIHGAKNSVVNSLGMPAHMVHLFTHFTGGGHGGKTGENTAVQCAAMSKAVNGYPVQFMNSRADNQQNKGRQFAMKSEIKIGAKSDGTFTGIDYKVWADGGRNANAPSSNAPFGIKNSYTCPDASFQVYGIATNAPARGYWRCVQDPPSAVNYDTAIDKLAQKMNMSPYDLRMKNMRSGPVEDQDSTNGRKWGGFELTDMFEWLHQESSYASKWHAPGTKTLSDGRLHGISIVGHIDGHASVSGGRRGGSVKMNPDGTCQVMVGAARGCEGGPTVCVHIVAETMGMKYEDVGLGEWGNTDITLDAGIQAGSGFTGGASSAFYNAAIELRNKVFAEAVNKTGLKEIAGITPADLMAKDGEIMYKNDPTKKITYRQAMSGTGPLGGADYGWNSSSSGGVAENGRGMGGAQIAKPGIEVGDPVNVNGVCASVAEVAVDTDTGEVEILGYWNCIDTGRTVFRQGTLKEIGSGIELMIAQCMYYGDVYDQATGACIASNYTEAMFPTPKDYKTERFVLQDWESNEAAGAFGAKGIGEPCCSNYVAIINAIFNATGKWVDPDKGPVTADKVLKALGKA